MSCDKTIEAGKSTGPDLQADTGRSEESSIEKEVSSQAGSSMLKRCSEVSEEEPPRKKLEAVNQNWNSFYELITAVERNDASAVQTIIRSDWNLIDVPDKIRKQIPLHCAAIQGCVGVVKELIRAGAKVNLQDRNGDTPLHHAAIGKDVEIVKDLLAAGANTRCQNYLHRTPLHLALKWGNEDIAELIVDSDPQNSLQDRDGYSPLHFAALGRRAGVVRKLLSAGANTRCLDCRHRTPLHISLQFEAEDIAELILDRDPKNGMQDINGRTPLHYAARNGYIGVARKLLAAGVTTRVQDNEGRTPLHCAMESVFKNIVELICDADPENNIQDNCGDTPLHYAVKERAVDVVRNVLFSGVHPHLLNIEGRSPLDIVLTTSRQPTGIITQAIASMCALREITVDWKKLSGWKVDVDYCMKLVAECEVEIQQMKETKGHRSSMSYHDVARQRVSKVAAYLINDDVRNELLNGKTAQSFPNYAELITFKVKKAERRRVLTESCLVNFALLSKHLPSLPENPCIENIFSYFNEFEMQNFVKVFIH